MAKKAPHKSKVSKSNSTPKKARPQASQKTGLKQSQGPASKVAVPLPDGDALLTLRRELARSLRAGQSRPPRTYRQWLESCVMIPDGKFRGQRFRVDRQPVVGLWIDAIDSGDFTEYVFTAPSQFGKTLIAFIAPLLYHTCEISENYVLGVPFADMAADKWDLDVKPVMQASPQLRRLMPIAGSGSAGGKVRDRITLRNGVEIKLMSAGGDDSAKAGFTSRVLGVTEAARFSTSGETSVEADPLRQLRARQRQYEDHERTTYVEGTVTIAEELPWALKPISTDSKIVCPCPHCEQWVAPERDDLIGWDAAKSDREAADLAFWACPSCGQKITEDERRSAVLEAKLLHRGQSVDKQGTIVGQAPDTGRLFFRAAAFHNLFLSAGSIGKDEWIAAQIPADSTERIFADRQLCQFVHCIPYHDPRFDDDLDLDKKAIGRRRMELPHQIVPADTAWLTAGVDIGEKKCWWLVLATRVDPTGNIFRHIVAYGDVDVPSNRMPLAKAIRRALLEVHDHLQTGFVIDGTSTRRMPDQVWYDCNFQTDTVLDFIRGLNNALELPAARRKYTPFVGSYGRGATSLAKTRYTAPRKTNNTIRDVDPSGLWYLEKIARAKTYAVLWDSDTSKWEFQQALTMEAFPTAANPQSDVEQTPGSITFYAGTSKIHERISQHFTNETLETVTTVTGKKKRWVRRGANHLFDCAAMAWRATERAKHIATKTIYSPPIIDPAADTPSTSSTSSPGRSREGNERERAPAPTQATTTTPKKTGTWYDNR